MRHVIPVTSCLTLLCVIGSVMAALPIRKPEAEGVVEKVASPSAAEQKAGVVVTIFLKDRKGGLAITKETAIHRQMGKVVPAGEVRDIKIGSKVSVWVHAKTGAAEGVLIFP